MADHDKSPIDSEQSSDEPEAIGRGRIGRRMFLTGVLGAVLTDQVATRLKWGNDETSLRIHDVEGAKDGVVTIVLGGLGVQSGEGIMQALMPALQNNQFAGFVRYADTGFDIDTVAEHINRAQHELGFRGVRLYLHSMAGATLPALFARFDKAVSVTEVDYNCSPWTPAYTFDESAINFLSRQPFSGSFATKLLVQLVERFNQDKYPDDSLGDRLNTAWRITQDEGSPVTWMGQVRHLAQMNDADYGVLPESLRSRYLTPADLNTDPVVRLEPSLDTYLERIPGAKAVVKVEAVGHANPRQNSDAYIRALNESNTIFDSTPKSFGT